MSIDALYQHHERTTTSALEADLALREIGIDPVQKFLTAYSEVLGLKIHAVTQESPAVAFGGTLSVAGLVTLSNLSASSAVATDASKNLVSVSNTGSGNNVLSASPTLTGTINAASLTLSSALTLSASPINRVPYTTTGGLVVSSSNLTFDGSTLALTGLLTMNSLTASSALATNASKQLVSVTNTGTGNNVLSASPTFTGTISAVNLALSGGQTIAGALTVEGGISQTALADMVINNSGGDVVLSAASAIVLQTTSGPVYINPVGTVYITPTVGLSVGSPLTLTTFPTGRIPYTTTAGLLTSGTGLTYNGSAFSVTGTGAFSGDFAINTNKFNITGSNGNTSIAGTIGVTGAAALGAQTTIKGAASSTSRPLILRTGLSSGGANNDYVDMLFRGMNTGSSVIDGGSIRCTFTDVTTRNAKIGIYGSLAEVQTLGLEVASNGAVTMPVTLSVTGTSTLTGDVTLNNDLLVNGITTVKNIIQYDDPSDFFLMNVNTGDVALSTNSGDIRFQPTGGNVIFESPTAPASASDTGTEGEFAWSTTHLYFCVATDTWKRVAIATW